MICVFVETYSSDKENQCDLLIKSHGGKQVISRHAMKWTLDLQLIQNKGDLIIESHDKTNDFSLSDMHAVVTVYK